MQRGLALTQERPEIILRGLRRTENGSGQAQARGAAPELRPIPEAARDTPRPWGAFHRLHVSRTQPGSQRPFDLQRSAATCEGCGGTLPPRGPPAHARVASGTRVRRLSPGPYRVGDRCPPAPRPGGPALDAGALRQYIAKPSKEGGKTTEGGAALGRTAIDINNVSGHEWMPCPYPHKA